MSFLTSSVAALVKTGKSHNWQSYNFNALQALAFPNIASVGAAAASTTVQARLALPQPSKIAKVGVSWSAINALDGTHKFQIVAGTAAYTVGTVPPQDNAQVYGYCTTPAVAGNCLFSADVTFDTTNFVNGTTTGGSGVLVPTVYDSVWSDARSYIITVRCVTPASTGSITNLGIVLYLEGVDPYPQSSAAVPITDW